MRLSSAILGSVLVVGCGGVSSSREFEGRKMACIQIIDGGIKAVERFGGVIEDLAIDTRGKALQAGLNLSWLKAESEEVIGDLREHCSDPALDRDADVSGMAVKFKLKVAEVSEKIRAMGKGETQELPLEVPVGPGI